MMVGAYAILVESRRLRVPHIAWIEIPGGPFVYQQGETRDLPTFWIARYPITNAQFQTFIDDDGYRDEHWWRDLQKPEREASQWLQGNRPRTKVDWYEAVAFTRWLTARLSLPDGSIRLPTEFEWEKAARGESGPAYPWGNKYRSGFANVDETYKFRNDGPWNLQQTTAVGLYPHGRSPYGLEDPSGNILEWCLNKLAKPDLNETDTSGNPRALRGGDWLHNRILARIVERFWIQPNLRAVCAGFRLASAVAIPVR